MTKKFLDRLSSIFLPVFATVWIIAMIKLWRWNVDGTGMWFAFLMVFAGFAVLTASLAHTFGLFRNIMYWKLWGKYRKKQQ